MFEGLGETEEKQLFVMDIFIRDCTKGYIIGTSGIYGFRITKAEDVEPFSFEAIRALKDVKDFLNIV